MQSGELLADVESAHYMEVSDLDLNEEMIITGGKDCKVKVWLVADLVKNDTSRPLHFCEFGDHTAEVT